MNKNKVISPFHSFYRLVYPFSACLMKSKLLERWSCKIVIIHIFSYTYLMISKIPTIWFVFIIIIIGS